MSTNLASSFARYLLRFQSDRVFLSSISTMDFENRVVSIRSGYWKLLVTFLKNNFDLEGVNMGFMCRILKEAFIERFSTCSATSIKDFMFHNVKRSFYDFKNMIYYIYDLSQNGNIKKRLKRVRSIRNTRFYEKKAYQFYQKYRTGYRNIVNEDNSSEVNTSVLSDQELVEPDQSRIHFHDIDETIQDLGLDPTLPSNHADYLVSVAGYPESEVDYDSDVDVNQDYSSACRIIPQLPYKPTYAYGSANAAFGIFENSENTFSDYKFITETRTYHTGEYDVVEGYTRNIYDDGVLRESSFISTEHLAYPSVPPDTVQETRVSRTQ